MALTQTLASTPSIRRSTPSSAGTHVACMYTSNSLTNTTCTHHHLYACRKWRQNNPFAPFDRVAFNECCAATIAAIEIKLAAELARWEAAFSAWEKNGSLSELKPRGKPGNVVTRMYKRTGWWPLQKDSVLWQKAIDTLGALCAPSKHKLDEKKHLFADLNDKRIKLRALVLKSFQQDFIDRAFAAEEKCKQRSRRRAARISIENTYCGKGFTKKEVMHACYL